MFVNTTTAERSKSSLRIQPEKRSTTHFAGGVPPRLFNLGLGYFVVFIVCVRAINIMGNCAPTHSRRLFFLSLAPAPSPLSLTTCASMLLIFLPREARKPSPLLLTLLPPANAQKDSSLHVCSSRSFIMRAKKMMAQANSV